MNIYSVMDSMFDIEYSSDGFDCLEAITAKRSVADMRGEMFGIGLSLDKFSLPLAQRAPQLRTNGSMVHVDLLCAVFCALRRKPHTIK